MVEVRIEDVKRFMVEGFLAVGVPEEEAVAHSLLLIHADCTGHFSHGLNRYEYYINDIKTGACKPRALPVILKQTAATAWVDGKDALGATVGEFCMKLAIHKAKDSGVGWVSVKNCNHFGMAGYWAQKAEKEGLIGMAFTNSSPIMVPTRSKVAATGTNPISMFAPADGGDSLGVDLATTAVAMGKIEIQSHKGDPIPEGWALGPDGETTTDASLAMKCGHLQPLGGLEETSGYKGYALSTMVEVFCTVLSGSIPTHEVRSWSSGGHSAPPELGQCFVAINPECFAPGFGQRLLDCLKHWRGLVPIDASNPVLAPGDKEKKNYNQTSSRGTISYVRKQVEICNSLANQLHIKPLKTFSD